MVSLGAPGGRRTARSRLRRACVRAGWALCVWGLACGGAAASLTQDLLGLWNPLQSTSGVVQDGSGRGHPGQRRGPEGAASGPDFDGQTAVLIDAAQGADPRRAQTLSLWVHPSTLNRQSLFGQARNPTEWTSPRNGLFFSDFGTAAFAHWNPLAPAANLALVGSTPIPAQAWTLLTATYDGQDIRLYVNGRLDASKPWPHGLGGSAASLRIGSMREFDPYFKGRIGEVRLYGRGLGSEEVAELHTAGRPAHPAGPAVAVLAPQGIVMQARRDARARAWESFPAITLDELSDYRRTGGVALTAYGGRADRKAAATGFFRTLNDNGRWWLVDPDGGHFLHTAVVAVAPGRSPTVKASFEQRFGNTPQWARETTALLKEHGFNGTGAWSDVDSLRAAPQRMVYTVMSNFLVDFAQRRGLTRSAVGHSGYLKDSLPVFLPDFEAHCEQYARTHLSKFKDDPWLLGTFSDNELLTPDLKKYLSLDRNDPLQAPNLAAAERWLSERLGRAEVSAADVTWELDLAFQGYVFDHYFKTVSRAIKKVLPDHLYLGSRLNTERDKINPHTWRAAGRYVDVIALNLYRTWTPDVEQIDRWVQWSGRPVIITEWYVKGDDMGLPNVTGAGWIVPDQADRGRFYQQFAIKLLQSRGIVGWHWFKYMDNDPNDAGADASNRDANKGIVQLNHEPYKPVMDRMKALNLELYPLVDHFDRQAPRRPTP